MEKNHSIPKVIHYCWFGPNKKSDLVLACIQSWKKHCPDFVIKEWNESNYEISSPFAKRMLAEKKWAFIADYARLDALYKEGGVYLDTDMELVKDISPLLNHSLLLGEEETGIVSAGMIGAVPENDFIKSCKLKYDEVTGLPPTIPRLLTEVFAKYQHADQSILVCPPVFFYPYDQQHISEFKKKGVGSETYGVHLWNYSWGHPVLRFLNSWKIYNWGKKILAALGLKKLVKKILRIS